MDEQNINKVVRILNEGAEEEHRGINYRVHGDNNTNNIMMGNNSSVVIGNQAGSGPEMMKCPACKHPVSKTADACPRCFDNIAWRRQQAYEKKQDETALAVVVGFTVFATVYHWSGIWFGPEYAQWIATVSIAPVAWWAIRNWIRPS